MLLHVWVINILLFLLITMHLDIFDEKLLRCFLDLSNFLFRKKQTIWYPVKYCKGRTLVNICIRLFNIFGLHKVFSIKPHVLILLNKMVLLRKRIFQLYCTSLSLSLHLSLSPHLSSEAMSTTRLSRFTQCSVELLTFTY